MTILEEKRVDVIVTGLMMPKYNGVDLIQAVRAADYTNIPILVFTSGGNMELIEQAAMAGANEIVQTQHAAGEVDREDPEVARRAPERK